MSRFKVGHTHCISSKFLDDAAGLEISLCEVLSVTHLSL